MKLHLTDTDGTLHEFTLPDISQATVKQWVQAATLPDPEPGLVAQYERLYVLVEMFCDIPRDMVRRIPLENIQKLANALSEFAEKAKAERAHDAFIPDTVTHDGVLYRVPKDLGAELTTEQYVEISARLEALETEDQGLAVVLAVMLQEVGKPVGLYKVDKKVKAFESFPALMGIRLSAFFFAGNESLMQAWDLYSSRIIRSKLRISQEVLQSLQNTMDGTEPVSDGPSSSPSSTASTEIAAQ